MDRCNSPSAFRRSSRPWTRAAAWLTGAAGRRTASASTEDAGTEAGRAGQADPHHQHPTNRRRRSRPAPRNRCSCWPADRRPRGAGAHLRQRTAPAGTPHRRGPGQGAAPGGGPCPAEGGVRPHAALRLPQPQFYDRLSYIFASESFTQAYRRSRYLDRSPPTAGARPNSIEGTRDTLEATIAGLKEQQAEKGRCAKGRWPNAAAWPATARAPDRAQRPAQEEGRLKAQLKKQESSGTSWTPPSAASSRRRCAATRAATRAPSP